VRPCHRRARRVGAPSTAVARASSRRVRRDRATSLRRSIRRVRCGAAGRSRVEHGLASALRRELPPCAGRATVELNDVTWLAECTSDGDLAFRIGLTGDEVVAEWIGLVRLSARRDGSGARLDVLPGAVPEEVAKIERGSAQLLLRQLAG